MFYQILCVYMCVCVGIVSRVQDLRKEKKSNFFQFSRVERSLRRIWVGGMKNRIQIMQFSFIEKKYIFFSFVSVANGALLR